MADRIVAVASPRQREAKINNALRWVEGHLKHEGGPQDGRTAILVVRLDDVPGEPGMGFTNVFALPDIELGHLIDGLEKFIGDLKAGQFVHSAVVEGETQPSDETETKQ